MSIDAVVRGKSFRFVSTHLDGDCLPFAPAVQNAQAAEVLAGPAATDLPVIYVGDLNSPAPTGTAYNNALAAGFVDAWSHAGVGAGLTCCQEDDMFNPVSTLSSRIDFVLFRGNFTVRKIEVVGEELSNRTPSGLWPADHAGVVATLGLPRH